ncbi:CCA tRNA nucleotidyltransferase [Pontibacillus marinus]|uniref:CCA-adding enzyme n=1 Tax=Pontibacillus marinus BH030004 = DSM 16465 TaxID=1385511 RepID=A0A0A5G391_9BACI|nr:CCA tRNA nucleotidyltransferase [Pontibacillus marinus]KGX85535.1 poly(A) polymerase [Pontibacillus marinus BH030004 = DSM 16465]
MDKKFLDAMPVVLHLQSSGYDTYFVGGAVRDQLLGKEIWDIDIATAAKPDEVTELFDKVIPVGIDHGTVLVRYGGESYEVTTFRIDGEYNDFRHPEEVEYVSSIEEDLSRRDFTMNAIAMGKDGQIIDPYGGQEDIRAQKIKTVGSPDERFQEDPLRMMRAIRFVSQHGFELTDGTYSAFDQWKHLLSHIAIERIAVEFEKLFNGHELNKAWTLLVDSNLYAHLPILNESPQLMNSTKTIKWIPLNDLAEVITVFHILKPEISIDMWVKHWKLSNRIKRKSLTLVNAWDLWQNSKEKQCLYLLGEDHIAAFYRVLSTLNTHFDQDIKELFKAHHSLPIHSRKDLKVDGNDIKGWFPNEKPGPWIKRFMESVEELIINGELVNDSLEIKERVTSWNPHELN